MSEQSRNSGRAAADLPRIVDGAFDPADLEAWLRRTRGGYHRRMIGHDLAQLGVCHGDLLIGHPFEPLRYGDVAMMLATDFNYERAQVAGAGEVFRDTDGAPALRVDGEAWSVETDAYSYVEVVLGWVPVRDGALRLFGAKVLPRGSEEVTQHRPAPLTPRALEIAPRDLPF